MSYKPLLELDSLPVNLVLAFQNIYQPAGLECSSFPIREQEGKEYEAFRFSLCGKKIIYRLAKTTPTKLGQFVTCWKRSRINSNIEPFNEEDDFDFLIVGVHDEHHQGQFILSKHLLEHQKILKTPHSKGKLGFRLYPPWCHPESSQALKSQKWQLNTYMTVSDPKTLKRPQIIQLLQRNE